MCDKMAITAGQTHIRLTHKLYNYLTAELPQGETSHCDECQSQTYRNVSKSEISSFHLIGVVLHTKNSLSLKSFFLCLTVAVKSPHGAARFGQIKTCLTVRKQTSDLWSKCVFVNSSTARYFNIQTQNGEFDQNLDRPTTSFASW
jgi:hypothetical protein